MFDRFFNEKKRNTSMIHIYELYFNFNDMVYKLTYFSIHVYLEIYKREFQMELNKQRFQ